MNQQKTEPKVTLVVVPRERFSFTIPSLENIYEMTDTPFELVYVDGGSPAPIRDYLKNQAQTKGFELIRTEHYLVPNVARNMGLKRVKTPYVVFVDNDIIISPEWLEKLLNCAETTDATIVGPLMCQYEPVHEEVHFAGGEAHTFTDIKGRKRLREKMYKQGQKVGRALPKLTQIETELCEFHCMLVRTEVFQKVGYLDEKMLNTKEHLDFCMTVRKQGGTVYFEPASIVTYVPGITPNWSDLQFYMLRWSDAWELGSLSHLRQKWQVAEDMYFRQKYKGLGWRRRKTLLQPIVNRLTFGIKNRLLHKLLMYGLFAPIEKVINNYLTSRYARQWLNPSSSLPDNPPPQSSVTIINQNLR